MMEEAMALNGGRKIMSVVTCFDVGEKVHLSLTN
jgi:hypothetical protein